MMETSSDHGVQNPKKGIVLEAHEITDYAAKERRLVRKIDFIVLPLMLVAYALQFLDKQALASTSLMGILEDLNLHGNEYNWASSIFYFGYLAASYPVSLILIRFPLGKSLAILYIGWSVILACTAATKNWTGLMVVRFILGIAEAGISPGFSLLTSLWYRTSEQPLRHGIWFCGNAIASLFASLISYGVYQIQSQISSWKWLFIIFSLLTFFWGLILLWRLPDHPGTAPFLTEEEKIIALDRLRSNRAGFKNNKINRKQLIEALTDYKTWLLVIFSFGSNISNGGYTTFSALILKGFGFTTMHTLLLGMALAAIVLAAVLISAFLSSRIKNSRCIIIAVTNMISIVGAALIYTSNDLWTDFAGLALLGIYSTGMPLSLAMISSNVGGFTKRATVSSLLFLAYCTGNIIGPQLFFAREAPKYKSGFLSMMVCFGVPTVAILVLRVLLQRENKKRDMEYSRSGRLDTDDSNNDLLDITDLENKDFRYSF